MFEILTRVSLEFVKFINEKSGNFVVMKMCQPCVVRELKCISMFSDKIFCLFDIVYHFLSINFHRWPRPDRHCKTELETNIERAEQRLIYANLEERYDALFAASQQHNQWVREYTNELKKFANIKKINETIPRTSFRNVEIEPSDPTRQ